MLQPTGPFAAIPSGHTSVHVGPPPMHAPTYWPMPHYPAPHHSPSSTPTPSEPMLAMLRDISTRLGRIEVAMHSPGHPSALTPDSSSSSRSPGPHANSAQSTQSRLENRVPAGEHRSVDQGAPLHLLSEAVSRVERADEPTRAKVVSRDPIARGLITMAQAQQLFDFYFTHTHVVYSPFDARPTRDPAVVRATRPFLFHAILVTAAYYTLYSISDSARQTYHDLVDSFGDLLGRRLLTLREDGCTLDLIQALILVLLCKPVRSALDGPELPSFQAELACKLNDAMAFNVSGLLTRSITIARLEVSPEQLSANPSDPGLRDRIRAWLTAIIMDQYRALQTGRAPGMDIEALTQICPLFADTADANMPSDVQLAAIALVTTLVRQDADGSMDADDDPYLPAVQRTLAGWAAWRTTWLPRLVYLRDEHHQEALLDQALALSTFFILATCARAIRRWLARLAEDGVPEAQRSSRLSEGQWQVVEAARDAAEYLVSSLSVEARPQPGTIRQMRWPSRDQAQVLPPLTPDREYATRARNQFDQLTCLIIPHAMIWLFKASRDALLYCTLELRRPIWSPTGENRTPVLPRIRFGDKIHRLVGLVSDFLEHSAPHPTAVPAIHARVLRQIAATAIEAPYRDDKTNGHSALTPQPGDSATWFAGLDVPVTLPPLPTAAYSFIDATVAPAESGIDWASLLMLDGSSAPLPDPIASW